jgi:hypothetical protein
MAERSKFSDFRKVSALQGNMLVVGLDPNEPNLALQNVKFTYDDVRTFILTGVSTPEGFEWVGDEPVVTINPAGTEITVGAANATNNGNPVSFALKVFNVTLPPTGLQRLCVVSALMNGTYALTEGDNLANPIQPAQPTGSAFVSLLLLNPSGTTEVNPDQLVRYINGQLQDANGNPITIPAVEADYSTYQDANPIEDTDIGVLQKGATKFKFTFTSLVSYIRSKLTELVNHEQRITALEAVAPDAPAGFVWIREPVVTLSGTNNETINVSEGESQLNSDTPVIYPAATFTRALPASPNIRLDAVEARTNSTYGIVSSAEGLTVTRPPLTANAVWVADVILSSDGGTVKGGTTVKVVQTTGTSTKDVMSQKAVTDALNTKVDKVTGKGLSTEDYTNDEKQKLSGLSITVKTSDGTVQTIDMSTRQPGYVLTAHDTDPLILVFRDPSTITWNGGSGGTEPAPDAPILVINDVNNTATTTMLPSFINLADYEYELI